MAANAGPDIIEDGIVFYYDTGNTVKSFIGEPTTNFATNTPTPSGWPGNYTLIDSGTKTFDFVTSTVEWGGDASWTIYYYDVTAYTGQHICLSATYEYSSSPGGGNLAFVMIGQTTGSETYLGYSSPLDYNYYTPTASQQISWNGVIGNGGKIGILTWMSNGNSTTLTSRFSKVQLEVKTHPTQFVNGTRSATQGLLDMTRNSAINITNASFTPSAQLTFDGTNDYINVPYNTTQNLTSQGTVSVWIYPFATTQGPYAGLVAQCTGGSVNTQAYQLSWRQVSGALYGAICNGSGTYNEIYATLPSVANTWYNIMFTWNGSQLNMYNNGTVVGTTTQTINNQVLVTDLTIGGYTYKGAGGAGEYFNGKIANVEIYNRGLTASEVLTNYNALKTRFGI
jgi:hypothetical protein